MVGLLGKKIGMTQAFGTDGEVIPLTVIEAGPCAVLQVKSAERDGYFAIQLGFGEKKESRASKPDLGRFKKAGVSPKRFVRELRVMRGETEKDDKEYKLGKEILVDVFQQGDFVDISGISVGKGFQGGMKRWHWSGGPETHGSMSHRRPGSIGASSDPSRVFKGHHLPGRMGGKKVTTQNLEVARVDKENNLLLVKGAVPGHKNSYLVIKKAKKKSAPGHPNTRAPVKK